MNYTRTLFHSFKSTTTSRNQRINPNYSINFKCLLNILPLFCIPSGVVQKSIFNNIWQMHQINTFVIPVPGNIITHYHQEANHSFSDYLYHATTSLLHWIYHERRNKSLTVPFNNIIISLALTWTAQFRKQLFCPGPFNRPFAWP